MLPVCGTGQGGGAGAAQHHNLTAEAPRQGSGRPAAQPSPEVNLQARLGLGPDWDWGQTGAGRAAPQSMPMQAAKHPQRAHLVLALDKLVQLAQHRQLAQLQGARAGAARRVTPCAPAQHAGCRTARHARQPAKRRPAKRRPISSSRRPTRHPQCAAPGCARSSSARPACRGTRPAGAASQSPRRRSAGSMAAWGGQGQGRRKLGPGPGAGAARLVNDAQLQLSWLAVSKAAAAALHAANRERRSSPPRARR